MTRTKTPTDTPMETPTQQPVATLGAGGTLTVGDGAIEPGEDVGVTMTIFDAAGNPVAGVSCFFSIAGQPGAEARIDAGPVTTNTDGKATTTLHTGSTTGTIKVQAHCGAVTRVLDIHVVSPPASLPNTGAPPAGKGNNTRLALFELGLLLGLFGGLFATMRRLKGSP